MLVVAGAKRTAGAAEVGSSPKMSSKAMATDTKVERRLPPCTTIKLMREVHVTYIHRGPMSPVTIGTQAIIVESFFLPGEWRVS